MALPFRLLSVALQAETLRRRRRRSRAVVRIVCGAIGFVFLISAMAAGHLAIWYWLRGSLDRTQVSLVLGGGDLLLAILIVAVAALYGETRVERQARAVRRRALQGARQSPSLLVPNVARRLIGW